MGIREELQKRIDRKQEELQELQLKIREGTIYIQALQDTMKLLPKDGPVEIALRPGSNIAKARDVIKSAGKPLHINEILNALGPDVGKDKKLALTGSIGAYVRKGEIFTRPAPNTFGLAEFEQKNGRVQEEPPERFGIIDDEGPVT